MSTRSNGDVSDHALLDHYRSTRNPEMFLEIVRRHSGMVYGTCLRITSSCEDAEELAQECFFDLARQASQIRTSLVGWLHQTATHRAINCLRSEKRRKSRETEAGRRHIDTSEDKIAAEVTWKELVPLVDQFLAELPEDIRAPILMHYLEGATQGEIANTLGVHQSTVSRRLSDGIELLRERIRSTGIVAPATMLVACLTSQTAMSAPSSVAASLGKMSLVGIGAEVTGTSQMAWLASVSKGLSAILFLPLVAGVVWGEIIFLVVLGVLSLYISLCRPEWFRVISFTRQYPNIYEWPLFPFKRWTWQTPPGEWRLWMAASIVIGMELVGAAILAPLRLGTRQGSLLLIAAGFWFLFNGIRIWRRARHCNRNSLHVGNESDFPIDGALLLTYGLACAVLFAKLAVSPKFLSFYSSADPIFWLAIISSIVWSTTLVFGTLLTLKRFRQWCTQGRAGPAVERHINRLAPPRWLLISLFVVAIGFATRITYESLIQDVHPFYIPLGDSPGAAAQRQTLALSLSAMDCVILAILPLGYLFRRIPRVAWGVGFGTLALIAVFHTGFFIRNLMVSPAFKAQPLFASPPLTEVLPNEFMVSAMRLQEIDSGGPRSQYMADLMLVNIRLAEDATVILEYAGRSAILNVRLDERGQMAFTGVTVHVQVMPQEFRNGIPSEFAVFLAISDPINRKQQSQVIVLPLSTNLTPEKWYSNFELKEQAAERSYAIGETVDLGWVQEKPLSLKVVSPVP
jgi:RNA polymerase sigma factor (sigma-70 family)